MATGDSWTPCLLPLPSLMFTHLLPAYTVGVTWTILRPSSCSSSSHTWSVRDCSCMHLLSVLSWKTMDVPLTSYILQEEHNCALTATSTELRPRKNDKNIRLYLILPLPSAQPLSLKHHEPKPQQKPSNNTSPWQIATPNTAALLVSVLPLCTTGH